MVLFIFDAFLKEYSRFFLMAIFNYLRVCKARRKPGQHVRQHPDQHLLANMLLPFALHVGSFNNMLAVIKCWPTNFIIT